MVAASSSSPPVRHHLLPVLIALLAVAGHVAASAGSGGGRNAGVGEKSAVLSLRELEWGAAAARKTIQRRRYAQAKQAGFLGEHKKAAGEAARRSTTTVLKLKHHSSTTIPDHPAARERYLRNLLAADDARAASLQLPKRKAASTT